MRAPTSVPCLLQGEVEINLDEARGPIREWIAQEPVRREVSRRFARLLRTFTDDNGDAVYRQRVRDMCRGEAPHRPAQARPPACLSSISRARAGQARLILGLLCPPMRAGHTAGSAAGHIRSTR